MEQDDSIQVSPSLDSFINEQENTGTHKDGGKCDFRLGKGNPLGKTKCAFCSKLSMLMDLMNSWKQFIDSGRLNGRSIEIVPGCNSKVKLKDVEAIWELYVECDNHQRQTQQCTLRRYFCSFTCDGAHYYLREMTSNSTSSQFSVICRQLINLFLNENSFPKNFVHGNPTAASISFLGKLPVALKKENCRYLIQIDCALVESYAVSIRQRKIVSEDGISGSVIYDKNKQTITIHKDSTFDSFLSDYPRHFIPIAFFMLYRGLLSFFPSSEISWFLQFTSPSKALSLRQAFEEIKGLTFRADLAEFLLSRVSCPVMT